MSSGWICVHRRIIESEIWGASANTLKVWLWCLCRANHEPGEVYGYPLQRGEFVTSTHAGPVEVKVKRSTFIDALKWLEDRGMIERRSDQRRTIITVCKYSTYQHTEKDARPKSDQSPTNNRPKSDQNPTQTTRTTPDAQPPTTNSRPQRAGARHQYTQEFERFWKAYPAAGRKDKYKAAPAFQKALGRASVETIVEAAARYAGSPRVLSGTVQHATTWLNGNAWEDDPAVWEQIVGGNGKPKQREIIQLEITDGSDQL